MVQRKKRVVKKQTFEFKKEYIFYISGFILFVFLIDFFSTENAPQTEPKKISAKTIEAQSIEIPQTKRRVRLPQIEIQNGCGIEGIAGKFKPVLMKANIDVIATGNYKDFSQKKSFLIVHDRASIKLAESIALKLGLTKKDIKEDIQKSPLNELTLVLGTDFGKLNTKESQ